MKKAEPREAAIGPTNTTAASARAATKAIVPAGPESALRVRLRVRATGAPPSNTSCPLCERGRGGAPRAPSYSGLDLDVRGYDVDRDPVQRGAGGLVDRQDMRRGVARCGEAVGAQGPGVIRGLGHFGQDLQAGGHVATVGVDRAPDGCDLNL